MENLRQKCKIFNYRPLVLVFLGLIGGALISTFIGYQNFTIILISIIAVAVLVFYCILHKKFKYAVILGLAVVIGFGVNALYTNAREHKQVNLVDKYIEATVTKITTYSNCLGLILEDVKIEGKKTDYNILLYYQNVNETGYKKIETGTKIGFIVVSQGEVEYKIENGEPHTYNLSNNIGAEVNADEVTILGQNSSVRNSILKRIRSNLRLGLNNQNGEMIYSAMFGDKTNLDDELYDAYKTAGVAHLLAVSGLHVGLVSAIIYWILKKLKVKNWYRVIIVAILLFAYAYLCNFSYSVIRASIMALVLMVAPMFFREYDLLNSICLAGCIIVLIEPIALFDPGALLSFGCVLGIAMLSPLFKNLLKKLPIPTSIKDGFGISLATLINTIIIMASYFGNLQPISLISNLIILPIFSVLFTMAFILAIGSLILPFVSYLLIVLNPLFEWTNWAIIFIANITDNLPLISANYLTIMLYFMLLAFIGKYNLKKGFNKFMLASTCACILAVQMALI